MAGDAGEEGAVLAQAQGAQEVFVTDEHQAKSRRVGQVEAQQKTHFFQAAIGQALGFVQDNKGNDFAEFRQGGLDQSQIGFAAEGRRFAQLGGQGREQAGGAQAGVSQQQREEQSPVQTA